MMKERELSDKHWPETSGVMAAWRWLVSKCSWREGKANITSRVWLGGSCDFGVLERIVSPLESVFSLSETGNLSTAATKESDD